MTAQAPPICIRVDDVGDDDAATDALLSALRDAGIPASCQVVPAWLTPSTARGLGRRRDRAPELVELAQHGFSHANHAPAGGRKHEFGEGRSIEDQRRDLLAGRRRLEALLGDAFTPGFCPPHDRLTHDTLRVLRAEAYLFVAGGPRTFEEMPVPDGLFTAVFGVDASERGPTGRLCRPASAVLGQLKAARGPLAGIVLHAREMNDVARSALVRGLARCREEGRMFVTLAEASGRLARRSLGGRL
ncbi:MAG: polysaccharide deacetylase family protein [Polyangiales bacterium]